MAKLFKRLLEDIFGILPIAFVVLIVGITLIYFNKGILSFAQFILLLETLIWPSVFMLSVLFFRKVLTYLFFSVESFNFFGLKGKLRDVYAVIEERAEEKYIKTVQDEQSLTERTELERKLKSKENLNSDNKEQILNLLDKTTQLSFENQNLTIENKNLRQYKEVYSDYGTSLSEKDMQREIDRLTMLIEQLTESLKK